MSQWAIIFLSPLKSRHPFGAQYWDLLPRGQEEGGQRSVKGTAFKKVLPPEASCALALWARAPCLPRPSPRPIGLSSCITQASLDAGSRNQYARIEQNAETD